MATPPADAAAPCRRSGRGPRPRACSCRGSRAQPRTRRRLWTVEHLGQVDLVDDLPGDGGEVEPRQCGVDIDPGDHRIGIDPLHDRLQVDPRGDGVQIDGADDRVEIEPVDDRVQIHLFEDRGDVDPRDHGVEVRACDDGVDVEQGGQEVDVDVPSHELGKVHLGHRRVDHGWDHPPDDFPGQALHLRAHLRASLGQLRNRGVGDVPDHHPDTAADEVGRGQNGRGEGGREPHDGGACADHDVGNLRPVATPLRARHASSMRRAVSARPHPGGARPRERGGESAGRSVGQGDSAAPAVAFPACWLMSTISHLGGCVTRGGAP